jgi:hypothetical protein
MKSPFKVYKTEDINNFSEFYQNICDLNKDYSRIYFRGQSKDWPLLPKAYRPLIKVENDEKFLAQWEISAIKYINPLPENLWHKLSAL